MKFLDFFRRRRRRYAFDFWVTLTDHPEIRSLVRKLYSQGHEIHIVSAISPGLPLDNDEAYARLLQRLNVPFTKIWRTDHVPEQKVEVLCSIKADGFWDDDPAYISAARRAGFKTTLVG